TSVSAPITRTKSSSPTNDSGCANGLRTITARPLSSGRPSVLHELVGLARRLVAHAAAAVHVLAVATPEAPERAVKAIPQHRALTEVAMKVAVMVVVKLRRRLPRNERPVLDARVIARVVIEEVDEEAIVREDVH